MSDVPLSAPAHLNFSSLLPGHKWHLSLQVPDTQGEHIKAEGFCAWDTETLPESCFYAEYGSYGPGAEKGGLTAERGEKTEENDRENSEEESKEESKDKNKKSETAGKIKRAAFAKQLSKEEAEAYTMVSGKGKILRPTPNIAPLICGAYYNTQAEGFLTMA